MKQWIAVSATCALLGAPVAAQAPAPPKGFDAYVQRVMTQWQVPGLAVAIVKDGKVVLARGYGVRELGKPERVDSATIFDIGSNTKAFTAAALGTLVSSGKLSWDDHVVDYVRPFRLSSPYITAEITLRDLLTHDSGYCDPGMWYTSDDTAVIERLRYQKPDYPFRTTFCYNNMLYLTASRFIPAVTGEPWDRYIAEHVFAPLDMRSTVTMEAQVAAAPNVAMPHGMVDGKVVPIHRYWPHDMDIISPVGGIYSSAEDMSHWLLMLLADGQYEGRTVLDSSVVREMETPQIVIKPSGVGEEIRFWMPGGSFYTYGLGLFVQDLAGHTVVWHAGDIDGMASNLAIVPDAHLGVAVLSNMNGSDARFGILHYVLRSYLGLPPGNFSDSLYATTQRLRQRGEAARARLAATRNPEGQPPAPLASYVGTYSDPYAGTARVTLEDGHLVLRLENPDFAGDLEYWNDDTFQVRYRYRYRGTAYVTFATDVAGKPQSLSMGRGGLHYERVKGTGNGGAKPSP